MPRTSLVVIVALAGCGNKKAVEPAAGSGLGSASGSAIVAGPADAAVADAPAAAELVPKKLGEKEGVVFAETAGGEVSGIKDGARVPVVTKTDIGVGSPQEGSVTVSSGGKTVELKADRVLLEDDIIRSPDGKYIVFKPIVACGDLCHTVVWFIGVDGKRVKLGDGGPDVYVAYDPKGGNVAIGSAGLYIVNLADFVVKHFDGYMSPSYAPDGVLYVRNMEGSAFTLEGDKPKRVWKAPKKSADNEENGDDSDHNPVKFKNGKPDFSLEW